MPAAKFVGLVVPNGIAVGPLQVMEGVPIAVVVSNKLPSAAPSQEVGDGVRDAVGVGPAVIVAVAVAEQPPPADTVTV